MSAIGHAGEHPEGRFFPDTYRFAAGTTDRELFALAYRKMAETLEAAWSARAAALPLANAYEALTLASIVEKETGLASERPRIAGVFITRLRREHAAADRPDRDLRHRARPTTATSASATCAPTRRTTPTRVPACRRRRSRLPSREAIEAVTRPLETGDIFFVATGIGDGSHVFSATLEEHNAAVATLSGTPERKHAR